MPKVVPANGIEGKNTETVHLGRIFEACYEKGPELPAGDLRRKFKGRTGLQGIKLVIKIQIMLCLQSSVLARHGWALRKLCDAFASQPGFSNTQADAIQTYIQALFAGAPTGRSLPRNRWPEHQSKELWQPMVPLVVALHDHPDSGGIWENNLNSRIGKRGSGTNSS